jgi:SWI/SNF-related matrix-associated actin-dependent regulator 1 of chromatin subfamily A
MQLRHYQEAGALFLAQRNEALLADEMGLGKTAQALVAARRAVRLEDGVLIVCPATLKANWLAEIKMWCPEWYPHAGILSGKKAKHDSGLPLVTIVNYDILKAHHKSLCARKWGLVIADEAHYIKQARSQRTKALLTIPSVRRWAMSGSPVLNRPLELYPVLWWLRQKIVSSLTAFKIRYCGGLFGGGRGATNTAELRQKLEPIMLRRTKADVLTELPPKTRQVVPVQITDSGRAVIEQAVDGKIGMIQAAETGWDVEFEHLGDLATLRAALGEQKLPAAIDFVENLLEETGEKVLVFAHHKAVIDGLRQHFGKRALVIDGSTSVSSRQQIVNRFQTDPDCRVFIGNIRAAGVGITLTAAPIVVFAEYDWTPGVNEQAEDRAHRIGQNKPVNIYYLVAENSIDAMIANVILKKMLTLEKILAKSKQEPKPEPKKETMNQSLNAVNLSRAFRAIGNGFIQAADILAESAAQPQTEPQPASPKKRGKKPEPEPAAAEPAAAAAEPAAAAAEPAAAAAEPAAAAAEPAAAAAEPAAAAAEPAAAAAAAAEPAAAEFANDEAWKKACVEFASKAPGNIDLIKAYLTRAGLKNVREIPVSERESLINRSFQ